MPTEPPAPPDIIGHCWHCGADLTAADYGRENHCLTCGKANRSCRNCRNYQRGRPNDCIEPIAEPVADKQRANFCEHFDPNGDVGQPVAAPTGKGLCEAAEALFK